MVAAAIDGNHLAGLGDLAFTGGSGMPLARKHRVLRDDECHRIRREGIAVVIERAHRLERVRNGLRGHVDPNVAHQAARGARLESRALVRLGRQEGRHGGFQFGVCGKEVIDPLIPVDLPCADLASQIGDRFGPGELVSPKFRAHLDRPGRRRGRTNTHHR